MWLPDAHLCYFILSAARPCVAVLLHGAATSSAISPQMHQQNPADAPTESRGTTRIRRTPTESCLHLQRERVFKRPAAPTARHAGSFDCLMSSLILITMANGRGHCAWWQSCTVPNQTHRGNNKKRKMHAIKQIKICAEYRDMLPRPRLDLSGTPGLRPIGLSPGSWQTSLGLGSMSRYSAQILICIVHGHQFCLIGRTRVWFRQWSAAAWWKICPKVLSFQGNIYIDQYDNVGGLHWHVCVAQDIYVGKICIACLARLSGDGTLVVYLTSLMTSLISTRHPRDVVRVGVWNSLGL